MSLQSPLGKVRGLGAAKSGTHHWWMQRVTAIALIPLVCWFVSIVIRANLGTNSILSYLESPFNAVLMILFLSTGIYHGALGIKVILEDYVSCKCARTFLELFVNYFAIITAVAVVLSIAQVHIAGVKSGSHTDKEVYIDDEKQQMWKNEFFKIFNSN